MNNSALNLSLFRCSATRQSCASVAREKLARARREFRESCRIQEVQEQNAEAGSKSVYGRRQKSSNPCELQRQLPQNSRAWTLVT